MLFVSLAGLPGCTTSDDLKEKIEIGDRISPYYDGPEELAYCSTSPVYADPITITGTAQFKRREITSSGLGAPGPAAIPIRYAEVRVTDPDGVVTQCGETDALGNFSLDLPNDSRSHTLSIHARANNEKVKVSILDAPERNKLYSLSTSLKADSSQDIGTLIAPATGNILGGAFNIYDLILTANDYLRDQVGTCNVDHCTGFTVAPKVTVYWERGFNPASYFNGFSGVSFYLTEKNRLFILGGINGNTNHQDTDHFDTSVILHEYAHFLEDQFSITNSPGGLHGGNKLIDPRLALGEGWGNFFQAAVQYATSESHPKYIDTVGNEDGSTDFLFNIDLESSEATCSEGPNTPGCDQPVFPHEGNFREFSITRFLWDTIDTSGEDEAITEGFAEIWATLTAGNGYHNPHSNFRSIGRFHEIQHSLTNGQSSLTDWTNLRSQHRHLGNRREYALYVNATNDCEPMNFEMDPYDFKENNGGFDSSHLLRNNDFFHYHHPADGDLTLTLNYRTNGSNEADLDLYLYNSEARFGTLEDILVSKDLERNGLGTPCPENPNPEEYPDCPLTSPIESDILVLPNLPAGDYLINVHLHIDKAVRPHIGDLTSFELLLGNEGVRLCPTNLPEE